MKTADGCDSNVWIQHSLYELVLSAPLVSVLTLNYKQNIMEQMKQLEDTDGQLCSYPDRKHKLAVDSRWNTLKNFKLRPKERDERDEWMVGSSGGGICPDAGPRCHVGSWGRNSK